MTQKRRYSKRPAKDLSQTPSGKWLAGLTFPELKPGQLAIIAYLRLSVEKLSEADHLLALQRQFQTCQSLAKKLGGVVVAVRCDMAKSADTRKGERPEFQALLLELGNYQGLVGSHFYRVARDPEDITDLIRVYEAHPGLKFSTPQEALDLSTPMGRAAAYGAASRGLDELAVMSGRQADRHSQLREMGRYVGPRMFGVKGANHDQENTTEANYIRRAAVDVLSGKGVWEVQKEWEKAGVLSPRGNIMNRGVIRNMLLSPRIVGLLVHKPKVSAPIHEWTVQCEGQCEDEDCEGGHPLKSQVPAILTEQTWKALIAEMSGRGERQQSVGVKSRASYFLSGLCWGVPCGEAMNGQWHNTRDCHVYRCARGCCSISGPQLDKYIGKLLVTLWTERAEPVIPEAQPFTQQADLDYWLAELEKVEQSYRARAISMEEKLETKRSINQELAPLQKAWVAWNRSQATPAPRHTVDQWNQAQGDVGAMRRMARTELERIDISKASRKGARGLEPERVDPVWRPSSGASGSAQSPAQGQTGHAA